MERILQLPQVTQRTTEWYNIRKNLLTASDVASAIGVNPYQSKKALLKKKTQSNDLSSGGSAATEHGNKYEDEARFLFGELYNLKTEEVGLFVHKEHTWLGGSPDGVTSDGCLIEIKCPVTRAISHEIPKYYYPQVQVCMEILDVEACYFIQYKPETCFRPNEMDVILINRNRQWFEENLPVMKEFWDAVLNNRENPDSVCIDPKRVIDLKELGATTSICYVDSSSESGTDSDDECQ